MTHYDFQALNDKDFEALGVDLLSSHFGVRVERFKPGRDQGVDGRWFSGNRDEVIVQCKHWAGSGYSALLRHLVKSERPKIERLRCKRYVLVTSVPLSRKNKAEILAKLSPFVLTPADVFGAQDLTDLLARHDAVVKRHYKLWLASSATLSSLLNNAIEGRSRVELEQIREEATVYVRTADHDRANKQLSERRVLLVTGVPGIGKTTLARQLALEHVAAGWDFVALEENISEAEAVFNPERRQLFYFDDFLGRTFLEAIRAKQDSHIVSFIKRVARDPSKRLVLTSRTNILNQGAVLSDILSDGRIVKDTYELRVGTLTKLDRAQILYNHVWRSVLDPEYIDQIYEGRRYHHIIDHPNFNPRLVAFVVDDTKVADIPAPKYWGYVRATFDNPKDVWHHFFDAQMNQDGRDLAYMVVLNGGSIAESDLRAAFARLRSRDGTNRADTDHRFHISIRHITGAVVNRSLRGRASAVYSLFNPSISDYVQARLAGSELWEYYYAALRTPAALQRLKQMNAQPFFGKKAHARVLRAAFNAEQERGFATDRYSLALSIDLLEHDLLRSTGEAALRLWFGADDADYSSLDETLALRAFLAAKDILAEAALERVTDKLGDYWEYKSVPLDEPELISAVAEALGSMRAEWASQQLRRCIIDEWSENAVETVQEADILGQFFDDEEAPDAERRVGAFVRDELAGLGVTLTPKELDKLSGKIDVQAEIEKNRHALGLEDANAEWWQEYGGRVSDAGNEEAAVDDLFDRS
jgi:hypothetical protein